MDFLPDDRRHASGGEKIDAAAHDAIRLAHRALDRFPELVRRHKFIAGGAAISSSLVVLAGVAIARRVRGGQSQEEALATVTEDELQGLRVVDLDQQVEETEAAESDAAESDAEDVAGVLGETAAQVQLGSSNGSSLPDAVAAKGHAVEG